MGARKRSHCVFVFLPLGFEIAPSVFLFFSHCVFVFLPLCFWRETLKLKMKHRYTIFHRLNALIINKLKRKSET